MNIYNEIDVPRNPKEYFASDDCKDLIKFFEGVRLNAYQDTGNVWTIGVGHTKGVYPGQKITEEESDQFLTEDLHDAENAVKALVTRDLYQCQFDALVSFVFNLGYGNFLESTLLKRINSFNDDDVPKQLSRWVYDEGVVLSGLEKRRLAEGLMYQGKPWTDYSLIYKKS